MDNLSGLLMKPPRVSYSQFQNFIGIDPLSFSFCTAELDIVADQGHILGDLITVVEFERN